MFNQNHDDVTSWTVLIVDDEPDNIGVPEGLLAFYGARVYTAANGAEGLKVLEQVIPTVILLDLSMPVMDGWEMLSQIKAGAEWQGICVIALTAHAMAGDREKVLAAGFDGYISKPFDLLTFISKIKNIRAASERGRNNTESFNND